MKPEQTALEITKSLARAMLMADLLTHRLSQAYAEMEKPGHAELSYAVEEEGRAMIRVLDAAQDIVLDSRHTAA